MTLQIKSLLIASVLGASLATSAVAKPPLREVAEIDDNMLWVGIAIRVSDRCPTLKPRTLKGVNFLWSLKDRAMELGYSKDEIKAYIGSDDEEKRIRKRGRDYARDRGFDPKTVEGLCALGHAEIAASSVIGSLLLAVE